MKQKEVKRSSHSDTSFGAGSLRAARRAAGAVQHAVDQVLSGRNRNAFCIIRPPGHHAGVNGLLDNAESCGFCIFNNVAAGAMHALNIMHHRYDENFKVAIVDIDVHHGNGTEEIVRRAHDPSRLFFFSVHLFDKGRNNSGGDNYHFYPGTGDRDDVANNIINIPITPLWKESDSIEAVMNTSLSTASTNSHNTRRKTRAVAAMESKNNATSTKSGRGTDSSLSSGDDNNTDNVVDVESGNGIQEKSKVDIDIATASSATTSKKTAIKSSNPKNNNSNSIGAGRLAYRRAIRTRLLPSLRAFNPDLILISAGFDACKDDVGNAKHLAEGKQKMGLDLEPDDYAWTTRKVMEIADICCQGRIVSVLEGGYGRQPMQQEGDTTLFDDDTIENNRSGEDIVKKGNQSNEKRKKKNSFLLDKSIFSEAAIRHLGRMIDPYNSGRRERLIKIPGDESDNDDDDDDDDCNAQWI